MRDLVSFVAAIPLLIALDLAMWIMEPERRFVRSAVLAGLAVGRLVTGAAW